MSSVKTPITAHMAAEPAGHNGFSGQEGRDGTVARGSGAVDAIEQGLIEQGLMCSAERSVTAAP